MSRSSERPRTHIPGTAAGRVVGGTVVAVLFMGSTLLTPLYDLYRSNYGFSAFVLVLLYAVYVIGNLLALLVFGRLSDQVGRKPIIFSALGLALVSAAVFFVARSIGWLFLARIVSGLAVGIGSGAATAWITEFTPPERRARAASLMTGFNFFGLALGPLLAGALVEYAPHPFRLPFAAYAIVLLITALIVAAQSETLATRAKPNLNPRFGVPPGMRAAFLAPAASGFAAMAVVGFYAALGPTTIRSDIGVANRALASLIVAELFVVAAGLILVTRKMAARSAMLIGLAATPVGMALLILAQRLGSLPIMLAGTAACGVIGALGYRGGLAVANALAPTDRRAEVASAFFVCCFCGNAIPIIGVGALTQATNPHFADLVFAGVVTAIALIAFVAAFTPVANAAGVSRPTGRAAD
jgi:predicted MFS family arabinose efflux permease